MFIFMIIYNLSIFFWDLSFIVKFYLYFAILSQYYVNLLFYLNKI